jgi:hypothetical protein
MITSLIRVPRSSVDQFDWIEPARMMRIRVDQFHPGAALFTVATGLKILLEAANVRVR